MAKKQRNLVKGSKPIRKQHDLFIISTEGETERDYFNMQAFTQIPGVVFKFAGNPRKGRSNPKKVLKAINEKISKTQLSAADQAWAIIDTDLWNDDEINAVLEWVNKDSRYHAAISNPKFELFLILHFEDGNGCTTAVEVDRRIKKCIGNYKKHLTSTQFTKDEVEGAVKKAAIRRQNNSDKLPAEGMTDVHLLVQELFKYQ